MSARTHRSLALVAMRHYPAAPQHGRVGPSPALGAVRMASPYNLTGQAAVVTGSTSGIGQALARSLAGEGVNIVLNGLGDPDRIQADRAALAEQTGVKVLYHGADMTK